MPFTVHPSTQLKPLTLKRHCLDFMAAKIAASPSMQLTQWVKHSPKPASRTKSMFMKARPTPSLMTPVTATTPTPQPMAGRGPWPGLAVTLAERTSTKLGRVELVLRSVGTSEFRNEILRFPFLSSSVPLGRAKVANFD